MIDKFVRSVAEAMAGIKDGSTVIVSGFAQVGEPRALVAGLISRAPGTSPSSITPPGAAARASPG